MTPPVNEALTGALRAAQARLGCLPDGYDDEEWEDLYGLALLKFGRLTGNGDMPCRRWAS
jgi:hypothetical protein